MKDDADSMTAMNPSFSTSMRYLPAADRTHNRCRLIGEAVIVNARAGIDDSTVASLITVRRESVILPVRDAEVDCAGIARGKITSSRRAARNL